MRLIWSFKSLPELANLPDAERKAIWRWCYWKSFSKWPVWVALAGIGICSVLGDYFGGGFGGVIGAGIGGGIFGLVAANVARLFVSDALQTVPARTRTSDLMGFLTTLRRGPQIPEGDMEREEPNRESWLCYYGACLQYISSLHNQFIATLSIQGALAIGCLAAIHSVAESPGRKLIAPTLGVLGLLMELALTFIAIKLFRQHCVTCWMLARIERDRLALPNWASMKRLLGTKGNRLFTAPSTLVLTVAYGLALGAGIAVGSFVGL